MSDFLAKKSLGQNFLKNINILENLPYNISTKILINYLKLENLNKFYEKFIFIFQKEVADRIIAEENTKYFGRLAIFTSWKLHKEKIFDIAPENFNPIPKIWSSLIALKPKDEIFKINRADNLEYITNTFFSQRRKMINKPFKKIFQNQSSICEKIGLNLKDRPQNISVQKYLEITKIYEELT